VGVAWERAAKAHLERNEAHSAVTAFEHALRLFEKAEGMRPDSPDPVLRWNRCVRLLSNHPSLREAMRHSLEVRLTVKTHERRHGDDVPRVVLHDPQKRPRVARAQEVQIERADVRRSYVIGALEAENGALERGQSTSIP
jgi:hypothetical protein